MYCVSHGVCTILYVHICVRFGMKEESYIGCLVVYGGCTLYWYVHILCMVCP